MIHTMIMRPVYARAVFHPEEVQAAVQDTENKFFVKWFSVYIGKVL